MQAAVGYRLFSQVVSSGRIGMGLKRSAQQHSLTIILHFLSAEGGSIFALVNPVQVQLITP